MRKIKNQKGFTLTEMLVCVITLLLIGGICATGTGISIKSYQESRFETDSQMLESTLNMMLGDILRYAHNVSLSAADPATGSQHYQMSNDYYGMADGNIEIPADGTYKNRFVLHQAPGGTPTMLVGERVYAESLYVSNFQLIYADGIFQGSYDIESTLLNNKRECTFTYRSIAER